ncbi:MAG TPA: NADH-quinone oxidoreductase subunit L, partial [Anseongella sp.]|nr:NADH-quinone oxidoreductase subunit L [Anseongella sp.]
IYTFRMVFITFWGEARTPVSRRPGKVMTVPLGILAFFSIFAGFIELPHNMGHLTLFSGFLSPVLPAAEAVNGSAALEWLSQGIAAMLTLGGIWIAYVFFVRKPRLLPGLNKSSAGLQRFFHSGWGFDGLYATLLVRPFTWLAGINRQDITDRFYTGLASLSLWLNRQFVRTQNGILRWYIMGAAVGALIILTLSIFI